MVAVLSIILGIILFLVIAIALYIFKTQRTLVNLDELCKNAMSQIAVQLNSRWDALLALAKTAAQYAKHESETIISTINARRQNQVTTAEEAKQQQGELTQIMGRLMAIGEAYPELKANDLYLKTMDSVNSYEENVRMSRMVYNDTATKMNRVGSGDRPLTHNFSTNMRQAIRIDHQTAKFNASSSSCFLRF